MLTLRPRKAYYDKTRLSLNDNSVWIFCGFYGLDATAPSFGRDRMTTF